MDVYNWHTDTKLKPEQKDDTASSTLTKEPCHLPLHQEGHLHPKAHGAHFPASMIFSFLTTIDPAAPRSNELYQMLHNFEYLYCIASRTSEVAARHCDRLRLQLQFSKKLIVDLKSLSNPKCTRSSDLSTFCLQTLQFPVVVVYNQCFPLSCLHTGKEFATMPLHRR